MFSEIYVIYVWNYIRKFYGIFRGHKNVVTTCSHVAQGIKQESESVKETQKADSK